MGAFRSVLDKVPLGPVSELPSFFSNKNLPSTSGWYQEATAIVSKCCSLSNSLANNSKEEFSAMELKFLLGGLWLLEGRQSAHMIQVHVKYICVFIYGIIYNIGHLKVTD